MITTAVLKLLDDGATIYYSRFGNFETNTIYIGSGHQSTIVTHQEFEQLKQLGLIRDISPTFGSWYRWSKA